MRVLIADDEDYTREGLIEAVDWEQYEIDEIMQAVNGAEAEKIAKWFCPDIVITDIRMPKLDGIAFAARLQEMNPESRIIFISGYMEIEYLKSAIRLDAVDFIEKPIELDAVNEALQKAVFEIQERKQGKEAALDQKTLQMQKLFGLLTGRESDEKTLEKLTAETGFPKNAEFLCLIGIYMGTEGQPEERLAEMGAVIESTGFAAVPNYQPEKQQFAFVIAYPARQQYQLAPMYRRMLEKCYGLRLGIGVEARNWRNIYNSYKTASMAVNCAFYKEDERLFFIDEQIWQQKNVIDPGIYGEFLQVLSQNPQRLEVWFDDLFERLGQCKYYHREQVYTLMVSLLTAIYKRYPALYEAYPGIREESQIQPRVSGAESLRKIRELFTAVLQYLRIREEERMGMSRIIRGVQDYVDQHYSEESLSVAEIAEHLHFSPAYLNVLFKQEAKMTLKQYLRDYRLERAKKMLTDGYEKITEIAEKCGYANANYFAKVFREAMDMTPAEYRKQTGGRDES